MRWLPRFYPQLSLLGLLLHTKQLSKKILSLVGSNKYIERQFLDGEVSLELVPQGTLAERCRAETFGIPAFYTPTGHSTAIETGNLPVRHERMEEGKQTKIAEMTKLREVRDFNGHGYVLDAAIHADVTIVQV